MKDAKWNSRCESSLEKKKKTDASEEINKWKESPDLEMVGQDCTKKKL